MTELASLVVSVSNKGVQATTDSLKKLSTQAGATEKQASALGKVIGTVGAALAGGAFFQAVVRNTIESENALAQLNATLASTKGAAGLTSAEIVSMAQGLQKVTTFGDDAIIAMESQLLTFTKLGKDVVPAATEAILDLATKMGGDLKGATVQIGKALNDPINGITALTKVGVTFTDAQKQAITAMVEMGDVAGAQSLILQELQTEFGGSARAARDTFGGAITALQNAFGDLLEGSGGNLTEAKVAVEGLTTALSDPRVQQAFGTMVAGVLNLATAAANALPDLVAFTNWAADSLGAAFGGAAIGDMIRLEAEMDSLNEKVRTQQMLHGKGVPEYLQVQIDATQAKIDRTRELADMESERARAAAYDLELAKQQKTATVQLTTATGDLTTAAERNTAAKAAERAESKAKAEALKAEKTATAELLAKQREAVAQAEASQAFRDQQQSRLGTADPVVGEQQRFNKEMEELRLLNAAKLIENDRYLELKKQAETAHSEQMAVLREEDFRKQDAVNELLMASLDQLQQGATNAFVGLLTGANNSQEAIQQLASSILNEAVGALVEMGIAQVKSIIMGQAAQTAATATSVAAGAATAAAWTPAAAAASIASFGGAAASGLAGMAAAIPAMIGMLSFDGGGFTGSGSRTGGMDGKGGFPAMLHPNETVIDHTKGGKSGGSGGGVTIPINVNVSATDGMSAADAQRQGAVIANQLEAKMMQVIAREKRPGGMLA
jgi:hypothetical protein